MAAVVNDKSKFISNIKDIITRYCRLALKYNKKIKVDGCLAVTVDDHETVVVNLSHTVEGHNLNSIYPSLRVNGRDGQTYVLLKEKPPGQTNTSTVDKSAVRTLSHQATPVIAGLSTNSPRCQVLKSTGTAHLLISPATLPSQVNKPRATPIFIVSPSKKAPSNNYMQSLITGKIVAKTATSSTLASSTGVVRLSSTAKQSDMGSRINVLQSRPLPELQRIEQVAEVKEEPDDPSYNHSQDVSRQITQYFSGELEGGTDNQDKENSSKESSSRRSSMHADCCNPPKRRRTNSAASIPVNHVTQSETKMCASQLEKAALEDSPRRKSSRLQGSAGNSEEASTRTQDNTQTTPGLAPEPSGEELATHDTTDEEYESEDDILSTATSEEEAEELYRCSEQFAADCARKVKRLDAMLESLKQEMESIGKDCTKEIKYKFTRSINTYQRTLGDLEVAKSKGSSNIRATENKLGKDFDGVLDHFHKLKEMMTPSNIKKSKSQARSKVINKSKPTSSSVKHTNKVLKNAKASRDGSKQNRVHRNCGECGPCKKETDCGKCKFCKDKVKYGGNNTLRQKCAKKQCVNKGRYVVQGKGKSLDCKERCR